ncbi:MAG: SelB C-terminal domain-containing protein [Candidatus Aminicenantes bacterium]|nr:SelB C-terminal domain-containing protein [Candidatus Aminicenantes bacterium]
MKTAAFDAVLDFPLGKLGQDVPAETVFLGGAVAARFTEYPLPGRKNVPFVRALAVGPVDVKWGDPFEVRTADGGIVGRGTCLYPGSPSPDELKLSKRKALLTRLSLGDKDMIMALAEEGGLKGLKGEDIAAFCRLPGSRVEDLAHLLEEEGKVRILAFSPLFLVSQGTLDFLRGRIGSFLTQYHKKNPSQRGAPLEKLEKRFDAPSTVLVLALRLLTKEGRIVEEGGIVRLSDFRIPLTAADEETLAALERMVLSGELGSVTMDDIQSQFKLTQGKLHTLHAVLAERKKIVEGLDGFILHSSWLEEIVRKVRGCGKRELTIADFKGMTGLSRKYSIPLLELLDSMGITKRKGSVRDIL